MRLNQTIILLLSILMTSIACNQELADPNQDMTEEQDVIKAVIEDCQTRTYLGLDGLSTYWIVKDKIGVYTKEGSSNLEFTLNTTQDALDGLFSGTLNGETPAYAYYPFAEQDGAYDAVELSLSSEQDASSIAMYDFKASNRLTQTGVDDYEMNFRGVLTMLDVEIDASGTPLAAMSLKSVKVKALPVEGAETPVLTGNFTMNLETISTAFASDGNDYAILVWDEPHALSKGKASAHMFVNPEGIKAGTPLVVTFETEEGNSATATFTSAKDCAPNTVYQFHMNLAELADKVTYEGNPIASLKFLQASNTRLVKSSLYTGSGLNNGQDYVNSATSYDIECSYDESQGLWTAVIPYLYDFSDLVASFETVVEGATVYVNDVQQESGVTANDFNEIVTYEVVSAEGVRQSAKVKLVNSGLPVVTINGTVYSKNTDFDDIEGTTTINIDGTDYTCGLRLRGNSTQNMPKKPYAFKLDSKASILGMPKHKRWVLLANWLDRTMLRNDLAFYLAHQTDTWAPHGQHVEVVLNGVHVGNYYLCEQIKIDGNRLDIADYGWEDLSADVASPTTQDVADNIGYLLECDTAADETEIYFRVTSPVPFYVYIKDPGDASAYLGSSSSYGSTLAYTYIQNYFNSVGTALRYSNWSTLETLIDYKSFADHWIFTELTENQESKHPKSFYMYKDAGGKLCAGPAWDYDWGTFIPMENIGTNSSSAGSVKNNYTARYTMWYQYLFNDEAFVAVVKERWETMKAGFESALPYLDKKAAELEISDSYNHEMWPCTGFNREFPNFDEVLSWDDAVAQMRTSLEERIEWMDEQIASL